MYMDPCISGVLVYKDCFISGALVVYKARCLSIVLCIWNDV